MVGFGLPLVLVVLFTLTTSTYGSPSIALPVNSQVPPVARVGQRFDFTFSYATFSSQLAITYSLTDAPSWLSIDSAGHRLHGQPTKADEGPHEFILVATDESGSTTMPVTMIVSSTAGPTLNPSFQQQLSSLGTFQSPNALLFYPEVPVNLQFAAGTFQETDSNTQFYAVGANNTPLPSWLQFDPSTLLFHGKTPIFTSPTELPLDIDVTFVASNVPGFSQAIAAFTITVESHELLFTSSNYIIEASVGADVSYSGLASSLKIDGAAMPIGNIISVSADQPSWLQLDTSSLTFSGRVPKDIESSNFTITVADGIGDTATTTIQILASGGSDTTNTTELILASIGPMNATIGALFLYPFHQNDFAKGSISLTLDLGNASSWLHFDNKTLLLSGTVPADSKEQSLPINLMASQGGKSQSQVIILNLVKAKQGSATASATATSSMESIVPTSKTTGKSTPSSTTSHAAAGNNGGDTSSPNLRVILPAALCPILAILLAILLFCCLRRRRKEEEERKRCNRYSDLNNGAVPGRPEPKPRTFGLFKGGSIFSSTAKSSPLLPPPATSQEKGRPQNSGRAANIGIAVSSGQEAPTRPARPPSGAPQITRAILDRDADPLANFREEHHLVDDARPDSVALPAVPPKSLLRNRSQSEPNRQSFRQSRASISSLLSRAANGRLSAMLQAARNGPSDAEELESGMRRTSSQPQSSTYTSFFDSLDGTNRYDFQDQTDSDKSRRVVGGSQAFTSSGDWTTSSGSALDPSANSSGDPNRNTSSTINGFFAQASPPRPTTSRGRPTTSRGLSNANSRFANTTIRGVTPSISSVSASNPNSPSKRHSYTRRLSFLGSKRTSQSSIDRKRHSNNSTSGRPLSLHYSPKKSKSRRSWTNNQYGEYLKLRRQGPATTRFSNSGLYRKSSSIYHRSSSLLESGSGSGSNGSVLGIDVDGSDKENASPSRHSHVQIHPHGQHDLNVNLALARSPSVPLSPLASAALSPERKRSRGSVQRLGRQMQTSSPPPGNHAFKSSHQLSPAHTQGRNLPFSPSPFSRMASVRSMTSAGSASDISFRVIEEEVMAEVQDNARYWRNTRLGSQRRNSLHRLSALPERGASGEGGFRVSEGRKGTPVMTTPQDEELGVSRSFKGELGEWRGTESEGSGSAGGVTKSGETGLTGKQNETKGNDFFPVSSSNYQVASSDYGGSEGSTSKMFI